MSICPPNPTPFRIWHPLPPELEGPRIRVKASAYLKRIAELDLEGDTEKADRVRANYLRAYPGVEVPPLAVAVHGCPPPAVIRPPKLRREPKPKKEPKRKYRPANRTRPAA